MGITSAIVLFAVVWFLVLFISLPIRLETQGDRGEIEPGTHAGAPADFSFKRRAKLVTVITVVIWAVLAGIITSGVIHVRDFDWFHRMGPASSEQTGK
jgi:predicted secreted protein